MIYKLKKEYEGQARQISTIRPKLSWFISLIFFPIEIKTTIMTKIETSVQEIFSKPSQLANHEKRQSV